MNVRVVQSITAKVYGLPICILLYSTLSVQNDEP